MMAVSALTNADSILQYVNKENLTKIESFLNDSAYREAIENSSTYNSRLCRERRLRMPFLDSQTGVAQNHSALFMSARERLPGLLHGQIYTYPSKRWRKKRRQYLMNYFHPKRVIRGDLEDGIDCIESTIPGVNDDSKDSLALKDEHSKDAWFYDESDMLDMDQYDEPDPDSDFDYEESYSSKRKRRKGRGGHHPTRGGHPPAVDSPTGRKAKGGGRGRKKVNYDASDTDKPFVCDLCSARYKTRPGLVYHYGHSHSTSSGDPAKELSPSPADVESRNVADAVASDQPGGSRRGRQGSSSTASSSPSVAATSSSISGSGGGSGLGSGTGVVGPVNGKTSSPGGPNHQPAQHQAQQQQQQQQTRQLLPAESSCAAAPASPTVSAISKDDHHPHHQPHQHPQQQQQQPQLPHQGQHPHSPVGPPGGPLGLGVQNNSCLDGMGDSSIPQHHQGNQHHAGGMDGKKGKPVHPSPYCDFCLGNARENKKTGGSEELVSCSDCGRSGHPTCLQFTANMIISVRKYKWQCIECKCCSICGTSDNDDQLLFCDDCDRGYHMYCLAPPLTSPPEGSWSCRLCIAEFHQGIPPPSRLP